MCSKYYMKHTSTKKIIRWNPNLSGYPVYYLNNSTDFSLQKHFIQRKYGALEPITHPQSIYQSLLPGVSPFRPFSVGLSSVQFSSVAQSCPTLCNPMNCSMPGLPVHHQLPEVTQTQAHRVGDAIQPSQPLLSPFPPSPTPSQHQSLVQWVNSSCDVTKVLEFQL